MFFIILGIVLYAYYIFFNYIYLEKFYYVNIFIMLSLIYYGEFAKILNISLGKINVNIYEILIYSTLLCIIIKKFFNKKKFKIKMNITDRLMIFLIMIEIIYLLLGLNRYNSTISDFRMYLYFSIVYFVGRIMNINFYKYYKIALYGLYINSTLSILLYPFKNMFGLVNEVGRYSIGIYSLYVLTIPLSFYILLKEKCEKKLFVIIGILTQFACLIISQNRTNLGMVILGCFLIYLITFFKTKKNQYLNIVINIIFIIFIIIVGILVINYLVDNNSEIITRLLDVFNKSGSFEAFEGRGVTANYYIDLIKHNFIGYGLGINMPLLTLDYNFYQQYGLCIDNGFITMAYKMGVLYLIVYSIIILISEIKFLKLYFLNRDNIYLILFFTIPMLLISISVMTSQIIHNSAIVLFIWTLFASINNMNYSKK